jgi:hypothetical protein
VRFLKLVKNRIGIEWKNAFNHNVDQTQREIDRLDQRDHYTNNRIDNLVLSAGGDSPNEVVDARVNWRGDRFATLQARLIAGEELSSQERQELVIKINNLNDGYDQLLEVIQMLYGGSGGVQTIYVSKNGNDVTGDGTELKPFSTIQAAINSLPLLSTTHFIVRVGVGAYLEDVVVRGLKAARLEIEAENTESVSAITQNLGCYLRSVEFIDCDMYCRIRGFQSTDIANSPGHFVKYTRVAYGAIENCRATASTINHGSYNTFFYNGSVGNAYTCWASNQRMVLRAEFAATTRLSGDIAGNSNTVVCGARGAIIYRDTAASITGTTMEQRSLGGQIFS